MLAAQITAHLLTSSLIPTLLKAQTSPHSSLATKMTLRDCTLFVQVPRELIPDPTASEEPTSPIAPETPPPAASGSPVPKIPDIKSNHTLYCIPNSDHKPSTRRIRIVIADLDEKSEANRGEYWKSLEAELINGGYYLGN